MIGIKDQCFGVEVEMTGITREQAAWALANYFGTEPYYVGGGYDKWHNAAENMVGGADAGRLIYL